QRMAPRTNSGATLQGSHTRRGRRPGRHRIRSQPRLPTGTGGLLQAQPRARGRWSLMPPQGGRANFASLVGAVGDNSPVDRKRTPAPKKTTVEPVEGQLLADVPVDQLIANP